ncbi:MAG: hypothetical protein DMD33_20145 [Gemmatimonadetes bacterium]|nr:MAG: hypothetical protein DMD33_20145 [Gemmatimonadota bacterium]
MCDDGTREAFVLFLIRAFAASAASSGAGRTSPASELGAVACAALPLMRVVPRRCTFWMDRLPTLPDVAETVLAVADSSSARLVTRTSSFCFLNGLLRCEFVHWNRVREQQTREFAGMTVTAQLTLPE